MFMTLCLDLFAGTNAWILEVCLKRYRGSANMAYKPINVVQFQKPKMGSGNAPDGVTLCNKIDPEVNFRAVAKENLYIYHDPFTHDQREELGTAYFILRTNTASRVIC